MAAGQRGERPVRRRLTFAEVADRVRAVPDPEVPVVTIGDLGILRSVAEVDGVLHVVVTPTYSGCPAMEAIGSAIHRAAGTAGWRVEVSTRLSPAWTTDWLSEHGRAALAACGIVPPPAGGPTPVALTRRQVCCPRCGSEDTEVLARFGSTACKALMRCRSCREPFEQFKAL